MGSVDLAAQLPGDGKAEGQEDSREEVTVLVTGFGPFKTEYPQNPSWEIARELPEYLPANLPPVQKEPPDPPPDGSPSPWWSGQQPREEQAQLKPEKRSFLSDTNSGIISSNHDTSSRPTLSGDRTPRVRIQVHPEPVRVSYQAVRDLVPKLWGDGESAPPSRDPASNPREQTIPSHPQKSPDFVLHIGMAGAAPIQYQLERLGHRDGYRMPDVDGQLLKDDERRAREGADWIWFGLPPELETQVDIVEVYERWVGNCGLDPKLFKMSKDPGRFLCDFVYFSSLAHLYKQDRRRTVLFLHVPADASAKAVEFGREIVLRLIRAIVRSEFAKGRPGV